jgi:Zn-dependent M32 family carboxypeptidase
MYNTLAFMGAKIGKESKCQTRITAAEMSFMRTTAKYIWRDYKRNDDILKELKMEPVMRKIIKYKNNWIHHVNRIRICLVFVL